jgi:hypothetical protein
MFGIALPKSNLLIFLCNEDTKPILNQEVRKQDRKKRNILRKTNNA